MCAELGIQSNWTKTHHYDVLLALHKDIQQLDYVVMHDSSCIIDLHEAFALAQEAANHCKQGIGSAM